MSEAPEQRTGRGPSSPERRRARNQAAVRLALLLVVVGLVVAFAAQNANEVSVHFLFVSGRTRLIYVIVACILVGAAVGGLIGWRVARRRSRRARARERGR